MAPALGTGSVAWSALLAVALGSLAVGNLVGGGLSERASAECILVRLLVIASLAFLVFSQCYTPVMRWAACLSLISGSILAALITQAVPMMMLGCVTPILIRGHPNAEMRGRWSGAVLAAGSVGGVAGALVLGLWLLPAVGLSRSYLLISIVLLVVALPIAIATRQWFGVVATLGAATLALFLLLWSKIPGIIQSQYGQIELANIGDARVLLIDGLPQSGIPQTAEKWSGLRSGYLLELSLLINPRLRDALIIGLGAALAPRLLSSHGVRCECVEIDPCVARIAKEEFGFDGSVILNDGRRFLFETDCSWDLIFLDVCTSDRLALHLFTVEAFDLVRRRLTPEGILAVQFIGDDKEWAASLLRTLDKVFGKSIMLAPLVGPWQNVGPRWVFTSPTPFRTPSESLTAFETGLPWRVVRPRVKGSLLTDDHFPAEQAWARTAVQWRQIFVLTE